MLTMGSQSSGIMWCHFFTQDVTVIPTTQDVMVMLTMDSQSFGIM